MTVTAVVIVPLVMLLMFATVQYAIAWYAKAALNAAAEDGLRATQTNPELNPTVAARSSLDANAAFIDNVTISTAEPAPGRVTVIVTGNVAGAFPGLTWTITGRASGPLETFRPQGY